MGMSAEGSNSGSYIIDGAISSQNSIAFNQKMVMLRIFLGFFSYLFYENY